MKHGGDRKSDQDASLQVDRATADTGDTVVRAVLNPDIQAGVQEFAEAQSDRICAIVGAAVVEEALLQALAARLRKSSIREQMFSPGRPLGDFIAKINLGYLLHMFEKEAHAALTGVAEVRNSFAHKLMASSFDDALFTENFKRFKLHASYTKYPSPFWDGDTDYSLEACNTRRDIFVTNIKVLLVLLMRDFTTHLPDSNVPLPRQAAVVRPAHEPPTSPQKFS